MNAKDYERMRRWITQLSQIQEEIEDTLSRELAWKKTLRKQDPQFETADLNCDSLGYAVDDLDSILENLEELISEQQ